MGHLGRDQAILNSFLRQNLRSQPRNSSRPSHLNLSSRNTNRSSMQKRTQSEYKYKITCMNRTPRQDVITRLSTTDVVYMLCHSSVRRSFHDSESLYRYFIELHIPGWIVWPLCWKSLEKQSDFSETTNIDVTYHITAPHDRAAKTVKYFESGGNGRPEFTGAAFEYGVVDLGINDATTRETT